MSGTRVNLPRDAGEQAGSGRRRAGNTKGPGLGSVTVVVVTVMALLGGGWWAVGKAQNFFSGPADFAGRGTGEVVVEIPSGSTGAAIGTILFDAGVVASAESFYQLALNDPRGSAIEAGSYSLRREMSAEAALAALVDRSNRVEGKVTVPEGARVGQVVAAIVSATDIAEADLTAALDDPSAIGLPDIAGGNPEGYLFPATYTVAPGTSAAELLSQMVDKTLDVAASLNIESRAEALGLTTEEVLTVASILEYEAKQDQDYPKVARVLYNRLDEGMPLQLDSTVSYVSQRSGDVWTTPEERANPSEYNTYQNTGLPPGPIGSPGEKTIEAALNPADGTWLYFVAVDLATGETKFANSLAEHERYAEEAREFCRQSDIC